MMRHGVGGLPGLPSAVRLPHVSFTSEKTLQYKAHNITAMPSILARSAIV